MQLSYDEGERRLLHNVASALKLPDSCSQITGSNGLLSASQFDEAAEAAYITSTELYNEHKLFGSKAQLEAYLGKAIGALSDSKAREAMFARALVGEVLEACHHVLIARAGIDIAPSTEDTNPKRNFYDHVLTAYGHTYLADSKLLAFQVNGNIGWSDWRKIRTVHHHSNPEMPQIDRLALILCSKCNLNLNIIAPIAVLRAPAFYKYTVDSPMSKRKGKLAPLYMHLKDKALRADDHVLFKSPFFGTYGTGTTNPLCEELLQLYKADPAQFTQLIDDETCLAD
jgi:hypothetical protein